VKRLTKNLLKFSLACSIVVVALVVVVDALYEEILPRLRSMERKS
jgi:hypothetical protein